MFGISSNMRIFLCREPVDMRKSYDGLTNLVEHYFHENVLGGSFFLFMNSQRSRLKILFFDSGGLCLFCKRLERGRFRLPTGENNQIDGISLEMLLCGIDFKNIKRLPRYKP